MLNILIILFTFFGLSLVVDNFLIPAVYKLKLIFGWTDDQTGTIISFVSSAPELSVSAVALFLANLNGDVAQASMGPGTVIGSALFSILFIVGASSWFSIKKLSWPAVVRDMVCYILSVLVVYIVVFDSKVHLWESLLLLTIFGLYTFIISKWKVILRWIGVHIDPTVIDKEVEVNKVLAKEFDLEEEKKLTIQEEKLNILNVPTKLLSYLFFKLSSKKTSLPKIFWNIFLSVAFVIFFSTLMVNNARDFASSLGISPVVISLTILAIGTSVPDLLASVKTAREGFGDTAIANAVGSNIFDILANLGLTWLVASIIKNGQSLDVDINNLNSSIVLLIAATVSLVLVMIAKQFNLGKPVSLFLMISYAAYLSMEVLKAMGKV